MCSRLTEGAVTVCGCGATWGHYVDDVQAEWGGDGFLLGIANRSLVAALRTQMAEGERTKDIRAVHLFLGHTKLESTVRSWESKWMTHWKSQSRLRFRPFSAKKSGYCAWVSFARACIGTGHPIDVALRPRSEFSPTV